MSIDYLEILEEVETANSLTYRNPMELPYGDPDRNTRSQILAWDFLKARKGKAPIIAMLGAKGSAKTHFGSAFAFHQGQNYPNSMGCIISNTYTQAKDNAGKLFAKMARQLGYEFEFFTSKKIGGEPYNSVYVADLDGKGYNHGHVFYMLVRSFDAVNKLEGIELDWLWVEEIQDAEKDAFVTVFSRVRGQNADRAVFIAGMPEDDFHWQYSLIPHVGATEENTVRKMLDIDPWEVDPDNPPESIPKTHLHLERADVRGVLFEPMVYENKDNLPDEYIPRLYDIYDEEMAKRYIFGQRSSLNTNRVVYQYNDHLHRRGIMSKLMTDYDSSLPITLSIDFNRAPMSATLWQEKPWNSAWNDVIYDQETGKIGYLEENDNGEQVIVEYDSLREIAQPNRKILAQIDEFEVWEGGTQGLIDEFKRRYANYDARHDEILQQRGLHYHTAGIVILGDATGDRLYSAATKTDWQIIRRAVNGLPAVKVLKGLKVNSNLKTGEVKYSNPSRFDTINNLNAALRDANGRVHVCFLPESEFKSGGAAKSVGTMTYKANGDVDKSADKDNARDAVRDHFFDTVRYVVWYWRGGTSEVAKDEFSGVMKDLRQNTHVDEQVFGGGRFGGEWGNIF